MSSRLMERKPAARLMMDCCRWPPTGLVSIGLLLTFLTPLKAQETCITPQPCTFDSDSVMADCLDDGLLCTTWGCSPITMTCVFWGDGSNAGCSDALFCNGDEWCDAKSCIGGIDDGEPCASDGQCSGGCCAIGACAGGSNPGAPCMTDYQCNGGSCSPLASGQCLDGDPVICPPDQWCSDEDGGQCIGCVFDSDCDGGDPCSGNETCDPITHVCVAETPVDCSHLNDFPCILGLCIPATGQCEEWFNEGVDCDDGDPCIPDGTCQGGVCVGDSLSVEAAGQRYLAVELPPLDNPVALYVSGVGEVSCVSGYVQGDGKVGLDPVYKTPAEWATTNDDPDLEPTVFVRGENLVSGMTYEVRLDCDSANPGTSFSDPASATLWRFGDTTGNGDAGIIDVLLCLYGFAGNFHSTLDSCTVDADCPQPWTGCDEEWVYYDVAGWCAFTRQNVDLIGRTWLGYPTCSPDGEIGIADVMMCLNAWRGTPDPCSVSCP